MVHVESSMMLQLCVYLDKLANFMLLIMKKICDFIDTLTPLQFEFLGNPTIKFHSDCVDVYFNIYSTIRDLSILSLDGPDEFRMFSSEKDGCITVVYTFYK